MRHWLVCAFLVSFILLPPLVSGCATGNGRARDDAAAKTDAAWRTGSARAMETIFSPLPWPAPNNQRTASGAPGPEYWQQRADYVIAAELDEKARAISGRATVTYTNNSPHKLSFIWIHLEQNLFNPTSIGARLTPPGARFGNRDGFVGGFEIKSIDSGGAQNPLVCHVYDTLARVELPEPIEQRGGKFSFDIAWSFKIPPYGSDRMGVDDCAQGPVFEVAQWFPAVAVYDDVHGWNTLPYLGAGEFYTNFGSYEVSLTVPATHIVGATGVLENPEEVLTDLQRERLSTARGGGDRTVMIRTAEEVAEPSSRPKGDAAGKLTWRFKADDVRTFAFASSAAFVWDASFLPGTGPGSGGEFGKPKEPGWSGMRGGAQGTLCQSLYPKEGAALWARSTEFLRECIEHYSKKWFAYPYPVATNVNGIVGGMEYPMVIFCRERNEERGLFGVTSHEIGHNWFPMTVSNDERRHAWMDEGFNTFINYYASLERYPDNLPHRGNARKFARDNERFTQPIETPADQLVPGTLGQLEYGKTATGLVILREGILGEERFDRAFREYIRRWAFKSPRPWDFCRTMEDVSGMDLTWFWRGWFYETGTLDQAVTTVMQPGGVEGSADSRNARVTFENLGRLVMPLVYKVTYDDGQEETRTLPVEAWYAADSWQTTWDTGGRKITKVVVDPDEQMPDTNLKNNVWGK